MPIIRKSGKDTVIFVSKEDHAIPSQIKLPEPEQRPGLFLPDGEINWNCPCLGGLATGPCGLEFRDAFTCFQKSLDEPKGSECFEVFQTMQMCMSNYPSLYNKDTDFEIEDLENDELENKQKQEMKAFENSNNDEISDKNSQNVINSNKELEVAKH